MKKQEVRKLVLAGLFLALCLVLPFLTGQLKELGNALSPMHIPVLLCGFICGWQYGLAVGFIAPLLRFLLFGMPPIFPIGISMAFELAAYGLLSGLLYNLLPKKTGNIYVTLIVSMLLGRIVWGITRVVILGVAGIEFTWAMFITAAFIKSVPGIIIHIILIPLIVIALQKANLMEDKKESC